MPKIDKGGVVIADGWRIIIESRQIVLQRMMGDQWRSQGYWSNTAKGLSFALHNNCMRRLAEEEPGSTDEAISALKGFVSEVLEATRHLREAS